MFENLFDPYETAAVAVAISRPPVLDVSDAQIPDALSDVRRNVR